MKSNIISFNNAFNLLPAYRALPHNTLLLITRTLTAHDSVRALEEDSVDVPGVADLAVVGYFLLGLQQAA